jgi:hypothetical protein
LYHKEYRHFHAMAQLFYSSNRSVTSYFWEARRLLGQETFLSPRHAFIHAVAGQLPRGYERVVLAEGETPAPFMHSVGMVEAARAERRQRFAAWRQADPTLTAGVSVQRRPVLAAGEFVWGNVLITAGYPEGLPCSRLVAQVVTLIDGQRSLAALLATLLATAETASHQHLAASVLATIEILYIDGAIADLRRNGHGF